MCPHFGQARLATANTQSLVLGAPVLLVTDVHDVIGCTFIAPGGVPSPCLTVVWLTGTTAGAPAALLQTSVGLCLNAAQVPQGPAVVVQTQTQALGT